MSKQMRSATRPALVVISHYNAWPPDQLIALLDQLQTIPAGQPFDVCVVVNQALPVPLSLPERHSRVSIHYRPNTGYNLGAWDHGWRVAEGYDHFLFLQEECQIQRAGWLRSFVRRLDRSRLGLVGESLVLKGLAWDERQAFANWFVEAAEPNGDRTDWSTFTRSFLLGSGIKPGRLATHLQALVVATRRDVLTRIDGFRIGQTKDQAIGCEVALSKQVEAAHYRVAQVRRRPFHYILHPQWESLRAESAGWRWAVRSLVQPIQTHRVSMAARRRIRRLVNGCRPHHLAEALSRSRVGTTVRLLSGRRGVEPAR